MAVGVVMDFTGATLEQYDKVLDRMGLIQGGPMPDGGISHWVYATEDGIRITDVWETREQYEKFAQEQIGPFAAEAGIQGPPEVSFHEAHNYLTKTPAMVTA